MRLASGAEALVARVRTKDGGRLNDIVWLHLDGHAMEEGDWSGGAQALGMYLNGDGIAGSDARGRPITDDHFLIYFNADGPATVTLPAEEFSHAWDVIIDTGGDVSTVTTHAAGATFEWSLTRRFRLRGELEAGYPLGDARFVITNQAEPVHEVDSLRGQAGLELAVAF